MKNLIVLFGQKLVILKTSDTPFHMDIAALIQKVQRNYDLSGQIQSRRILG
jgi:hypothetical protein